MEEIKKELSEDTQLPEVVEQSEERGASLVEYGLLVALIAVICIAAVKVLGTNVSATFSNIASGVGTA